MRYTAHFFGRAKGAIGIFHPCTATVEAANLEEAQLKLYDTHEHISGVRLEETPAHRCARCGETLPSAKCRCFDEDKDR